MLSHYKASGFSQGLFTLFLRHTSQRLRPRRFVAANRRSRKDLRDTRNTQCRNLRLAWRHCLHVDPLLGIAQNPNAPDCWPHPQTP